MKLSGMKVVKPARPAHRQLSGDHPQRSGRHLCPLAGCDPGTLAAEADRRRSGFRRTGHGGVECNSTLLLRPVPHLGTGHAAGPRDQGPSDRSGQTVAIDSESVEQSSVITG